MFFGLVLVWFFPLLLNWAIYTFFPVSRTVILIFWMWVRLLESGGRRVLLSWEQWHLWLQMSRQSCWDSNAKPWQRVKLWSHSLCLLRCWFDFSTIHLCSKRHLENIQEKHSRQKRSRVAARASWNQYKNKYHWMHFWKETLGITSPKSLTSTHLWRLMRVGLVILGGVEITKLGCSCSVRVAP